MLDISKREELILQSFMNILSQNEIHIPNQYLNFSFFQA